MKILPAFSVFVLILFSCNDMPPEEIYSEVGMKEVNGTELYYKILGQGEPLIIIHGGPGLNHQYLLPYLQPLSNEFQLIFYDQRACGQSSLDPDATTVTLENFILDIEGIRNAFGLEKINLMAHSWGGILAIKYAGKYPENVNSLILVNSVGLSSGIRTKANQLLAERFTEKDSISRSEILATQEFQNREAGAIESLMKIGFKHQFYNDSYLDELDLSLNDKYAETSRLLRNLAQDLTDFDFHGDLKQIKAPALLIYGDYDPLEDMAGKRIHDGIVDSKLIVLDSCGHFPFIEKPDEFIKTVRDFLN